VRGENMKKVSELKEIFEKSALEKPLKIGLIINKFSFIISKQLEKFLDSITKHTYRFFISLNIPISEKEVAYFLIFYDYDNEFLEEVSYTKLLSNEEGKALYSIPTVSISYLLHSVPPNLEEGENYPEIAKYTIEDYGDVSKLNLLFLHNIELDFEYYGNLL
jgi:hypothetical protein